jgi:hypothetical protein
MLVLVAILALPALALTAQAQGRGRGRDRDNDGIDDRYERRGTERVAERQGYEQGLRAGREDRARRERFDFRDEGAFQDATYGYRDEYGNRELYRRNFRQAFRQGYERGYGATNRNDDYRDRNRNDDYDSRRSDGYGDDDGSYRNDGYGDDDRYGNNQQQIAQQALNYGYREGYEAGRQDRSRNDRFDYQDEGAYRDATAGYRSQYGNRETYRRYFREGFQRGYEEGYEGRSRSNSDGRGGIFGSILEGILGRP